MFLEALGSTWHDTCFVCSVSKPYCPSQSLVLDTPGWGNMGGGGGAHRGKGDGGGGELR